MLKTVFENLLSTYTDDRGVVDEMWNEIETKYTGAKRHYHSLAHLENLYAQVKEVRELIQDWDTVLFTLFYHDVIYNASKSNNEEKSAELAVKRMQINILDSISDKVYNQILATKSHQISEDMDANLFTDADLSILGADWKTYENYCQLIRKEYSIYPNIIYRSGRKKVVKHFMAMPKIYKTDWFHEKYEAQAIKNLERELKTLL